MKANPTDNSDALILEPKVFDNELGVFLEGFNQNAFDAAVREHVEFVQDNRSRSARGLLRELHYQLSPYAHRNLARMTSARVFDVILDLRRSSPTFGTWVDVELCCENHRQPRLPDSMAHGILVLSKLADFLHETISNYAPAAEGALRWDDTHVANAWSLDGASPTLAAKDAAAPAWSSFASFA